MLLERLFYYRGENRTGWRAFVRNGYLLAALAVWASGVVFALEAPYPLPVEAYLLSVWMLPVTFYWTPLFQRGVVERIRLAAPLDGGLPARLLGFFLVSIPIGGTFILVVAAGGYLVSRQRGRVRDLLRTVNAVREREAEMLDEIAAMDVSGRGADARDYLHNVMTELHATPLHPADAGYRKQLLADMEANMDAVQNRQDAEAGADADTA